MVAAQFTVDEHVRVRTAIAVARAGAVGTIQFVYRFMHEVYDVQFDGQTRPQLMRARELEHADQESRS